MNGRHGTGAHGAPQWESAARPAQPLASLLQDIVKQISNEVHLDFEYITRQTLSNSCDNGKSQKPTCLKMSSFSASLRLDLHACRCWQDVHLGVS